MTRDDNGRFPKGVSGNPNGRPRKSDEQALIEMMDAKVAPSDFWDVLAKAAKQGKPWAVTLWAAYRYGKPVETIRATGASGGPLEFVIDLSEAARANNGAAPGAAEGVGE